MRLHKERQVQLVEGQRAQAAEGEGTWAGQGARQRQRWG